VLSRTFPSVLWHCWLGGRKSIRPVKKSRVLVCWWWRFDWSFARLTAPIVTTTSIILSFNEIQNGDILVPTNPCWKMAINTESVCVVMNNLLDSSWTFKSYECRTVGELRQSTTDYCNVYWNDLLCDIERNAQLVIATAARLLLHFYTREA